MSKEKQKNLYIKELVLLHVSEFNKTYEYTSSSYAAGVRTGLSLCGVDCSLSYSCTFVDCRGNKYFSAAAASPEEAKRLCFEIAPLSICSLVKKESKK